MYETLGNADATPSSPRQRRHARARRRRPRRHGRQDARRRPDGGVRRRAAQASRRPTTCTSALGIVMRRARRRRLTELSPQPRAAAAAGRPGARRDRRDVGRLLRRRRQRRRAPARPRRRQRDAGHRRGAASTRSIDCERSRFRSLDRMRCAAASSRCTCTCWRPCAASATPRRRCVRRHAGLGLRRARRHPPRLARPATASTPAPACRSCSAAARRRPTSSTTPRLALARRIDWHGGTFQLSDLSYNGTYRALRQRPRDHQPAPRHLHAARQRRDRPRRAAVGADQSVRALRGAEVRRHAARRRRSSSALKS